MLSAHKTPAQVDLWALQVIDAVRAGSFTEWDLVELKREWIDHVKAARRLAAHANTSRGGPILWLVGVDEKAKTATGAPAEELSRWWPAVQSHFDGGEAPSLIFTRAVPTDEGVQIVALYFDTSALPFVVKNPDP